MKFEINTSKDQMAVEAIAKKIAEIPANTKCEYKSLHDLLGHTKREAEAIMMAYYFCERMYSWKNPLHAENEKDLAIRAQADRIADEAIAKVGK